MFIWSALSEYCNCMNMNTKSMIYHAHCGTISGASSSQVILSRVFQVLAKEGTGWSWPQNGFVSIIKLLTRLLLHATLRHTGYTIILRIQRTETRSDKFHLTEFENSITHIIHMYLIIISCWRLYNYFNALTAALGKSNNSLKLVVVLFDNDFPSLSLSLVSTIEV